MGTREGSEIWLMHEKYSNKDNFLINLCIGFNVNELCSEIIFPMSNWWKFLPYWMLIEWFHFKHGPKQRTMKDWYKASETCTQGLRIFLPLKHWKQLLWIELATTREMVIRAIILDSNINLRELIVDDINATKKSDSKVICHASVRIKLWKYDGV